MTVTYPRFTRIDLKQFKADFLATARKVASSMEEFTSDDIWMAMPNMSMDTWAPDSGTVGSLMRTIKAERIAEPTGRVVLSRRAAGRGRAIQVWRSLQHGMAI